MLFGSDFFRVNAMCFLFFVSTYKSNMYYLGILFKKKGSVKNDIGDYER